MYIFALFYINEYNWIVLDITHALKNHRSLLKSNLECQYGLLDELEGRQVLTDEQVADVKRPQHNAFEQNDKLLSLMRQYPQTTKQGEFLGALRTTNQAHLTAYFIGLNENYPPGKT